ncbi:FAD-dependent oxidoreductase (plasmid) [Rhizobium sp. CB3060]|uniref:FAD-dependent oxidoreductase n=1 Tax=Rhizobium sp. CB3060 TaxID=3138255 RepID=UPI0021A90A3C|nr:FAD-dependent oxidoreductase [Rhizobium tropici]UWU26153.1 FAD-dependent oxidoreductase [Rhizobium tropici]
MAAVTARSDCAATTTSCPGAATKARARAVLDLGGRILSVDATGKPSGDGFDLGPSWFWLGMQPAMGGLVHQLGLHYFEQNSDGDVIFQRMAREAPQRYRGMRQEPRSMRLVGGTGAIISALAEGLPAESIELGAQVTHVSLEGVVVQYLDATGSAQRERASHVLFALPPHLIEAKILFSPALDFATLERWQRMQNSSRSTIVLSKLDVRRFQAQ